MWQHQSIEITWGWDGRLEFESRLHRILLETLGENTVTSKRRLRLADGKYLRIHLVTFNYLSIVGESKLL